MPGLRFFPLILISVALVASIFAIDEDSQFSFCNSPRGYFVYVPFSILTRDEPKPAVVFDSPDGTAMNCSRFNSKVLSSFLKPKVTRDLFYWSLKKVRGPVRIVSAFASRQSVSVTLKNVWFELGIPSNMNEFQWYPITFKSLLNFSSRISLLPRGFFRVDSDEYRFYAQDSAHRFFLARCPIASPSKCLWLTTPNLDLPDTNAFAESVTKYFSSCQNSSDLSEECVSTQIELHLLRNCASGEAMPWLESKLNHEQIVKLFNQQPLWFWSGPRYAAIMSCPRVTSWMADLQAVLQRQKRFEWIF